MALAEVGPRVTELDLWLLVSLPPCLAHDTVYTVAMQPASGKYVTRCTVLTAHKSAAMARWGALVTAMTEGLDSHDNGPRRQ
jgi:hypothetical protein